MYRITLIGSQYVTVNKTWLIVGHVGSSPGRHDMWSRTVRCENLKVAKIFKLSRWASVDTQWVSLIEDERHLVAL